MNTATATATRTAKKTIAWFALSWRFLFAFLLVFGTYNPSGASYFHWVFSIFENPETFHSGIFLITIILVIAWGIFFKATIQSLGVTGILLTTMLFGAVLWTIVDFGWVPLDNIEVMTYIVLSIFAMVMGIGLAWSGVWRKMTGQVDVDDVNH